MKSAPESLEPRIVLAADSGILGALSTDGLLTLATSAGADAFQVSHIGLSADHGEIIKVKDLVSGLEQMFGDASVGVRSIFADAGEGNDLIDFSTGELTSTVTYVGGGGDDSLIGPAGDSAWWITDENEGSIFSNFHFRSVENLTGATGNKDTFTFTAAGSLTGLLAGGDGGYDTVVLGGFYNALSYEMTGPQSGKLTLDGQGLAFAGMEPIEVSNATGTVTIDGTSGEDDIVLSMDVAGKMKVTGTGETIIFSNPTTAFILNGQGDDDTITINSLDPAWVADVFIYGNDDGGVVPNLSNDRIVFLNNVATRGGDLKAVADHIEVFPGMTVSTLGVGVGAAAGNIEFLAEHTSLSDLQNLSPLVVDTKAVSIEIGANAKLLGGEIRLLAQAEDKKLSENLDTAVPSFLINKLVGKVQDLTAMPVKVIWKGTEAEITLKSGAEITSTGSIFVSAEATTDSSGKAISKYFSVGYSKADASATVDVETGVHITAGKAVSITSTATGTATLETKTQREFPVGNTQFVVSMAVTDVDVTSHTTIAAGAEIHAGTVANVQALGNLTSVAKSSAGMSLAGVAGLSFSLEFSDADVLTTVNGKVTADLAGGGSLNPSFDPTTSSTSTLGYVDSTNDTIYVGPNFYQTGDAIVYRNHGGNSILGLADEKEYFVIRPADNPATTGIDESQFIQLAKSGDKAR